MARVGHPWRTHNAPTIRKMLREDHERELARRQREAETVLIELLNRTGADEYESWIEDIVTDADTWPEIMEKAKAKLRELDQQNDDPLHDWTNNPQHYQSNGVY